MLTNSPVLCCPGLFWHKERDGWSLMSWKHGGSWLQLQSAPFWVSSIVQNGPHITILLRLCFSLLLVHLYLLHICVHPSFHYLRRASLFSHDSLCLCLLVCQRLVSEHLSGLPHNCVVLLKDFTNTQTKWSNKYSCFDFTLTSNVLEPRRMRMRSFSISYLSPITFDNYSHSVDAFACRSWVAIYLNGTA